MGPGYSSHSVGNALLLHVVASEERNLASGSQKGLLEWLGVAGKAEREDLEPISPSSPQEPRNIRRIQQLPRDRAA